MPNPKKKLGLLISVIVGCLIIVGGLIFWLIYGTLEIHDLPKTSKVYIDGVEYNAEGIFSKKLIVKSYNLQITADNFVPYSEKIKIKSAKQNIIKEPLKPFLLSKPLADNVTNVSNSTDKKFYYYISDGVLFKADKDLNTKKLTAKTMDKVNNIYWSPNQSLAITLKENSAQLFDFKQYDILSQSITPWRNDIKSALWLNNERIIYYYAPPTGEKSLISTNKAHDNLETLLDLRQYTEDNADLILVPGSDLDIYIVGKDVLEFNLSTRQITPITNSGNIIKGVISPDKKYLALLTQKSLVFYDILNKDIINTNALPTIPLLTWLDKKVYFISDGRLAVTSPNESNIVYFNKEHNALLEKAKQVANIEKSIIFLIDNKLYKVEVK